MSEVSRKVSLEDFLVEVKPVVHAKWIWNEDCECFVCSNCEVSALNDYRGNSTSSPYCPNCGATMDLESEGTDE